MILSLNYNSRFGHAKCHCCEFADERFELFRQQGVEADGFDGHRVGLRQRAEKFDDLVAVLTNDLAEHDFAATASVWARVVVPS